MRMLRWMAGISRWEHKTNEVVRRAFEVEPMEDVIRRSRLRWHQKISESPDGPLKKFTDMINVVVVQGKRPKGRPRTTWRMLIKEDLKTLQLREKGDKIRSCRVIRMSPAHLRSPGNHGRKTEK